MDNIPPETRPFVLRIVLRRLDDGRAKADIEGIAQAGNYYPIHSWLGEPDLNPGQMDDMVTVLDRILYDRLAIQLQFPTDIR